MRIDITLILKICGGLLIVRGSLFFLGNQMGIFSIFPIVALITIMVGILLLVVGKRVATNAKQQSPTSLLQGQKVEVSEPIRPAQKVTTPNRIRPIQSTPQVPTQSSLLGRKLISKALLRGVSDPKIEEAKRWLRSIKLFLSSRQSSLQDWKGWQAVLLSSNGDSTK